MKKISILAVIVCNYTDDDGNLPADRNFYVAGWGGDGQ